MYMKMTYKKKISIIYCISVCVFDFTGSYNAY